MGLVAPSPPPPPGWICLGQTRRAVVVPFRLDLTVAALRRTPLNLVDILTEDGRYLCVARGGARPLVAVTTQAAGAPALDVALYTPLKGYRNRRGLVEAVAEWVGDRLGAGIDLTGFYAAAQDVPILSALVGRAFGVKPPRYGRLWEAICNAVVFQQVSIESATAVMRRLIAHYSPPIHFGDVTLYPFVPLLEVLESLPSVLRGLGLSEAKVRTLQGAARLLLGKHLAEAELEALPTPAAMARLCELRGVGPWTAAVIMLRGFGRLDVFPEGDSGARRSIRGLLGPEAGDAGDILEVLGPWRGMLYYHLLLWRLSQKGVVSLGPDDW